MLKEMGRASKETKVCNLGQFADGAQAPNDKLRCRRANPGGGFSFADPLNPAGQCPDGYSLISIPSQCG